MIGVSVSILLDRSHIVNDALKVKKPVVPGNMMIGLYMS
jgi:hypothetical protein